MSLTSKVPASNPFDFDDDDEDGWQEMPVIREDEFTSGMDEEDRKKYHYVPSAKHTAISGSGIGANATGGLIDIDDTGQEWRSKIDVEENEYTRLRIQEEDDADEVHLRTKYLFDEDKAMTPISQMQATKDMLTESQRIAYVGLCHLTCREMVKALTVTKRKEMKEAAQSMDLWSMKIMGRLYYHMELENQEQKMIESLAEHGVLATDLVPSLMTTHTVANPEYDPAEAKRRAEENVPDSPSEHDLDTVIDEKEADEPPTVPLPSPAHAPTTSGNIVNQPRTPSTHPPGTPFEPGHNARPSNLVMQPLTTKVLGETSVAPDAMAGVTTTLSAADKDVTLDIRWTVLCDLFLIIIADSVYDARSRVLLENVAGKLGLGWLDMVKFESRVTEALEIQEGIEKMESQDVIDGRNKAGRRKRYMIMGLATLGGGLVIGLSAGLLAPVIGAGLGAAFTTIGVGGTTGFLAGTGGAAIITTGGVLTGSGIAARGMAHRTQQVRTFDILPLHNNKRVSCILTVPGCLTGLNDDVRLPFSVLDPVVGDVFSVLWEPEMLRETGSALKILSAEVLSQISQTVLQATVMTALMSALQWPIILTKLGYLIDNPWNNALDRARAAGGMLADVLIQRYLGVRPITLIGFSLGARVIFYALVELAKQKAYGVVQDVILLGTTLSASNKTWCEARSVISGRFINGYARNDWVLNYLFRATSGGLATVAGLRPVENVPGLENVDVTDKIAGHMSYRAFMPLILDQLGFPVSADYFNEPEEPEFTEDRIVVREEDEKATKKGWFGRKKKQPVTSPTKVSRPPSAASWASPRSRSTATPDPSSPNDDLPPRVPAFSTAVEVNGDTSQSSVELPKHAGFDLAAMKEIIDNAAQRNPDELKDLQAPSHYPVPPFHPPTHRTESAPPLHESPSTTPVMKSSKVLSPELPTGAGTPSQVDLNATFQRSLSVSDMHEEPEEMMLSSYSDSTRKDSPFSPASIPATRLWPAASLPPGGFNSNWSSETGSLDTFDGQTFGSSTKVHLSGNMGGPPYGGNHLAFSANPFASGSSSELSFGGADGSITHAEVERDPWSARPLRSKTTAFNSNPWS